jgi:hypothetical protein
MEKSGAGAGSTSMKMEKIWLTFDACRVRHLSSVDRRLIVGLPTVDPPSACRASAARLPAGCSMGAADDPADGSKPWYYWLPTIPTITFYLQGIKQKRGNKEGIER